MSQRSYLLAFFSILLAWGLIVGIFVPWFEYTTHWNPPRWLQLTRTHEQLRFYEFGPDWYPELETRKLPGCYTTISPVLHAPQSSPPFRLHISALTDFETDQIRLVRLMGLFLVGVSLPLNLIFSGISLRNFIAYLINLHLRWYKYVALTVASVLLAGICLLGILIGLGPIVGTSVVNGIIDPLPGWQSCQAVPPLTLTGADYDLGEWKLNRILYLAPGLMILNTLLTIRAIISRQNYSG